MTTESNPWVLVLHELRSRSRPDGTNGARRRPRFFPDHDLARALDVARSLAPDDRILTSLCGSPGDVDMAEAVPGFVLDLPGTFGTAAGALLASARIHGRDPGATIVVLSPGTARGVPIRSLRHALRPTLDWTRRMPNHALVLVDGSREGGDRDWIVPAGTIGSGLPVRIEDLRVRVSADSERALRDQGALPSLGMVVVAARTMKAIYQTVEPALYRSLRPAFPEVESFRGSRLDAETREVFDRIAAEALPESTRSSLEDVLRRSLPWLMACPLRSGVDLRSGESGRSSRAAARSSRSAGIGAGAARP